MTFFVGHTGAVKLQRGGDNQFISSVAPDDINTSLNRFGFDGGDTNLITGDFVSFSTDDARGLEFLTSAPESIGAFIHINEAGGVRLFHNFADAINNNRAAEISLSSFSGEPLNIAVAIQDTRHNTLGSVTSFQVNTDRAALDTTSLSDVFRQQYSAGLLSGGGSIECLFSYETLNAEEVPLFLLQVINRLDVGSAFKALLSLSSVEKTASFTEEVYYDIEAVVTRAGVTVTADALVACSIDFVTTGEFKLVVGAPSDYILKEDDDAIYLEQDLDYLLQEVTD